jgi:2'-5' RNA ligase
VKPAVLWPGYYDVVIIPPEAVLAYAIEISSRLHRLGGKWKLGRRSFLPHVSLYHIPVRKTDFDSFRKEVRQIASETSPRALQLVGFDMPVLKVSKPAWFDDLHRRLIRRTVRFFDRGYRAEGAWGLDFFSGRRRQFAERYLETYGTPMFGMNFRPHITLTSFKGKEPPAEFVIEVTPLKFTPDHLAICELGESHSCQRVIERFAL